MNGWFYFNLFHSRLCDNLYYICSIYNNSVCGASYSIGTKKVIVIWHFDLSMFYLPSLQITMGGDHIFGKLAKYRSIITYSLSPYEQNPFAGYFRKGIPNMWRRFKGQVFRVTPRKFLSPRFQPLSG